MAVTDGAAHEAQALDMADQVRVRLEQAGGVGQAPRGDDPRGAGRAGAQGGGGGVDGGGVRAGGDEGLGKQGGPVQARLAVDVLGVAGEVRALQGRRGALVEGHVVVLADGRQHAGGVPGRLPGGVGLFARVSHVLCRKIAWILSCAAQVSEWLTPAGHCRRPWRCLAA